MKVVFHNIKGGCGKTTLVSHLSIALRYRGVKNIQLYDLDLLQSSLLRFMQLRKKYQLPYQSTSARMEEAIKSLADGRFVFFDLAGGIEKGYRNILEGADHIIVPVTFSPHTVASTQEYLESMQEIGLHQKCRVVFNAIKDEEQLASLEKIFPHHLKSHFRRRNGYDGEHVLRGITDIDRYYGYGDSDKERRQPSHYRIVREFDNMLMELGCLANPKQ